MIDDKRNGAQGPDDKIDQLSIDELRTQLRTARLEAEGWRTMILIAEEQLNIDIIKKPGVKQSKK